MNIPAILFGFLIAALLGSIFHLWLGGGAGRILLYIVLAMIGFWAGQLIANLLNWHFFSLGILRLGVAIPVSILFLGAGYWLSLIETGNYNE